MTVAAPRRHFWKLKGCPRCAGDLLVSAKDVQCLQCGYEREGLTAAPEVPTDLERRYERPQRSRVAVGRGLSKCIMPSVKADRDLQIRQRSALGLTNKELAGHYSLSVSMVGLILKGAR